MILKAFEVEGTDEFVAWYLGLSDRDHAAVTRAVDRLEAAGLALGYPQSSLLRGSRHGGMRELRIRSGRRAIRVAYIFDPRRVAMLLVGGHKTGGRAFYAAFVAQADGVYDAHIAALRREDSR